MATSLDAVLLYAVETGAEISSSMEQCGDSSFHWNDQVRIRYGKRVYEEESSGEEEEERTRTRVDDTGRDEIDG